MLLLCCLLTACRVPGAVRPVVRMGLVAPFEGRYRYVGYDVFPAVRLALRQANAAGGVGGYAVELVAYDDGADPLSAVEQARKLLADPEVVVVIGHFRDETTLAALATYADGGLPLVVPGLVNPSATDGAVFWWGVEADDLAAAMLDGLSSAALVDDGGPLGRALRALAPERGVTLAPLVAPGDPAGLAALSAADPPAVLCAADPLPCGETLAALRAAGWRGSFLGGPELAAADFAAVVGEAVEGAAFVTPWPSPEDVEGNADFIAAYREVSGGAPPGPLALPAYQATQRVLAALAADIAAHGTPSPPGVAAALESSAADERPPSLYRYRYGPSDSRLRNSPVVIAQMFRPDGAGTSPVNIRPQR